MGPPEATLPDGEEISLVSFNSLQQVCMTDLLTFHALFSMTTDFGEEMCCQHIAESDYSA